MNKHLYGQRGEEIALRFITDRGGELLEKNYRFKRGEIDLIVRDGDYIAFVEVKYRQNDHYGSAAEAVGYEKQRNISRGCDHYLIQKGLDEYTPVRFDVLTLEKTDDQRGDLYIKWIKNAFDYIPLRKKRGR